MSRKARIGASIVAVAGAAAVVVGALGVASSGKPMLPVVQPVAAAATPAMPGGVRSLAPAPSSGPAVTRPGRPLPAGPPDPPEWISIPALHVAAPVVERVSVLSSGPEKGLLGAPSDFHDLGWYDDGTNGVLLLDGHVGFAAGAGPLAYIGLLQRGDEVAVRFAHGSRAYLVSAVVSTRKGHLSPTWFTPRYDGWLMLITCDYQSPLRGGHFANNVYVVASPA